jgi:hypothetical protein
MKKKLEILKAAIAIIFVNINKANAEKGLNITYKYKSEPYEDKETKGWVFTISITELGHGEREIQQLRFTRPDNLDGYSMEYNVLMSVMSSAFDTSLFTWDQTGKLLNSDESMREAAKESLK